MNRSLALACALLAVIAAIAPGAVRAADATRTRIAVTTFPARFESDAMVSLIVGTALAAELERGGRYEVLAGGRLLQKLPADLHSRLGCFADACLLDIGAALNVDHVIGGSLDREGATLTVEVKVLDVVAGRVRARAVEPLHSAADPAVRDSVARLYGRMFLPGESFPGAGAEVRSRGGEVHGERGRVWSWVTGGTGLALSLVAGGLLLAANRDYGDAEDLLGRAKPPNEEGISYDQIRELETGAQDMEKAGWVLLGVGGAALVASVVLFIVEPGAAEEGEGEGGAAPGAPTALGPWIGPGSGGLLLKGRF